MDMENTINSSPAAKSANGDFLSKSPAAPAAQPTNTSVSTQASKPVSVSLSEDDLSDAVVRMNDFAQNLQRNIRFSIDEGSGRNVVTVLDRQTEEVIRQIPGEEVLNFARRIAEMQDETINLFSSQV